ncbi:MAG: competence protein CoiA family protein, partial [Chloroflexota bacterium]
MPLRALVNGVEVIAPALSEAEWDALRDTSARVILPCCGSEGYLRRSAMGTAHFAHKKGAHCAVGQGETIHHLKAKSDILIACQQAGYTALPEVAGDDWRADVLAVQGSVRIAFEVQWSFLRLEAATYRQ